MPKKNKKPKWWYAKKWKAKIVMQKEKYGEAKDAKAKDVGKKRKVNGE